MFTGSIVAIVTPMKANGDVDYSSLEKLVAWHLSNDTDGIVVLGTTGESATIIEAEKIKIIQSVIDQVNEKIPVIVGSGTNATHHTIELTRQAMELGADAALIVTPYYNKPTQAGLFQHFSAIAKAVPIPQILYNVPSRTGCDLLPETIIKLGKFANIVAVKEATGEVNRVKELLAADCEIDLLSGDDKTALEFMCAGGKGVISVVANIVPKAFHALCTAAIHGDRTTAEECEKKLKLLYSELFVESNPIPVKWALAKMGMIAEGIRLPLTPLAKQFHQRVLHAMQSAGIPVE